MCQGFEPKIIVFACNWCTYAGADLAGSLRYAYPSNVYLIRVPCSGRVEPEFIFYAFFSGADGVLIGGCHPGDCHYRYGNYYAHRRYNLLQRFLEVIGIEKDRLRLEWISGAEGLKFAQVATEFTEKIKSLGPVKIELKDKLDWKELSRVVAGVGSAGKVFWDESKCMTDVILSFLEFVQKNSCAQCIPCRIGTKRMQEVLSEILAGSIDGDGERLLKLLAEDIGYSSKCDLGRLAGKSVKYALECCYEDLLSHKQGICKKTIPGHPGWDKVVPL
ncbi:methyl-viologen-reducing hydrogenase subunit delta [Thermodesulfobacterium commune DSM 2178]|uniref:Methyl-viologen-reducing hydrogenase subunit delta n=2 Tax=Thermodesulfobacterium commune TaxID=1741 RepID=A0A075X108_9BACT|nr:methyl-viologen-reducing hydrogenase subunit delta [Thermodesulfobacterium commune DSM 2178]